MCYYWFNISTLSRNICSQQQGPKREGGTHRTGPLIRALTEERDQVEPRSDLWITNRGQVLQKQTRTAGSQQAFARVNK